jgi:hypothetical protein
MRLILVFGLLLSFDAAAQIRPFQSTRLISTSGAGVASLLVTETAILNPASLAFFSDTFVSYQNTNSDLKSKNDQRDIDGRAFSRSNRQEGYFLFDNASILKGGFSYQYQNENGFQRKRGTATFASALGESAAFGIIYRYTEDSRPEEYNYRHRVSHPVTLGLTWVYLPTLTFGATWDDPGRATPGESRAMIGSQYSLTERLMIIIDAGGDPTGDFSDTRIWRGAAQYNPLADLFIRLGRFQDRALNLEGESWGISWTGPKLGLDFAMKSSRQIENKLGILYQREKISDVSFAFNLRF